MRKIESRFSSIFICLTFTFFWSEIGRADSKNESLPISIPFLKNIEKKVPKDTFWRAVSDNEAKKKKPPYVHECGSMHTYIVLALKSEKTNFLEFEYIAFYFEKTLTTFNIKSRKYRVDVLNDKFQSIKSALAVKMSSATAEQGFPIRKNGVYFEPMTLRPSDGRFWEATPPKIKVYFLKENLNPIERELDVVYNSPTKEFPCSFPPTIINIEL